ncbi:PTS sugar transporter subunit IIA [Escherichia coli]|uniref:PTS sugar transporter subunit IIA n=1 Tax=Escherichia coli TaxID=562 RepID=UPI001793F9E7|nr:PTS sugar transporter subunit IIA [Escherichia coli]EFH8440925.1 PTS mannitol transporter subunit IIA [Escherichia coli]HAW0852403.1 PTS sugar transporter subunit IIA [Escherichia coli]
MTIFNAGNINLTTEANSVKDAIIAVGKLLSDNGYVDVGYIDAMLKREGVISTYVGNGVAVPHGIAGSDDLIFKSGISLIRLPQGIKWSDDEARIIIGIAGKDGTHMDILGKIAMVCSDEDNVEKLLNAESAEEIVKIFEEYEE